jgi:phospho-N-acetylmuramoyl-pentapeptide-transferase
VSEASNVRVWSLFLSWVEGGLFADVPPKAT